MSFFLTASLEPLKTIFPSITPKNCDVNCQMRVYSKVTNAVVKNVQNVEAVPGNFYIVTFFSLNQEIFIIAFSCFQNEY